MRLIKPRVHLYQDTIISSFLIMAPLFFPLGPLARILSVAGGVFIFGYVHITEFPGAIFPRMKRKTHLILDIAGVLIALILPWFLFSTSFETYYFFSVGLIATPLLIFSDFQLDMPGNAHSQKIDFHSVLTWFSKVAICFLISFMVLYVFTRFLPL